MAARYSTLAIVLHWLLAILILMTLGVGLTFEDMPLSPSKIQLLNWHKWAGISVLWLTGLRLAWRLTHQAPAPLPSLKNWEQKLSSAVHHLLYLLMFAIPLTGWLLSCAKGFPVVYFGLIPLPNLISKQTKEVAEVLEEVHGLLANGILLLVVLHAAGAIKHQWIDKNPILYRMGIGRSPKE